MRIENWVPVVAYRRRRSEVLTNQTAPVVLLIISSEDHQYEVQRQYSYLGRLSLFPWTRIRGLLKSTPYSVVSRTLTYWKYLRLRGVNAQCETG